MLERTSTNRKIGTWSAAGAAGIGIVYVVVGIIGIVARPPNSYALQVDPYLAILEALIILAAVALVVMMAAVYLYAAPNRKTHSLAALAFMISFSMNTCSVHFASLSVGRQIDPRALPWLFQQISFNSWPTLAMALDLLAWDFFLGLSLLFAAPVFNGDRLQDRIRIGLAVDGILCLAATLGPATGYMQIQYLGIAGYAFVLPVVCILIAMLFARAEDAATG